MVVEAAHTLNGEHDSISGLQPALRVGFDTRALQGSFKAHALRGTGRYVQELQNFFLSQQGGKVQVDTFTPDTLGRGDGVTACLEMFAKVFPLGRSTLRQQLCYPRLLNGRAAARFDILHFPAHIDAPSWCKKRYIVTVLDLIPLVLRHLYGSGLGGWRFRLARWLEIQAIRNAELVLAISENTARDVEKLLGIPAERIVVTPLGIGEEFLAQHSHNQQSRAAILQRYHAPPDRKIVLYVGGIDQRKNITGLISSFAGVVLRFRERSLKEPLLLIAGAIKQDAQYPRLRELIKHNGLEQHVYEVGYVADADLVQLYSLCDLFFFPSLYEGFGLTPLEAMACGAPVVSSDRSCMPEVLGRAVSYVNPEDTQACAQAVYDVLLNQELALSLRERGRRQAKNFTWAGTGAKTLAAYERLIS